jgi:hypothetical protein
MIYEAKASFLKSQILEATGKKSLSSALSIRFPLFNPVSVFLHVTMPLFIRLTIQQFLSL